MYPVPQLFQNQFHNVLDLFRLQGLEGNNVIHTVQEFRTEPGQQQLTHRFAVHVIPRFHDPLAADIAGHDDQGILEVYAAALTIGQAAVVQHLQQSIEHIGMSLFDFVEQDDRVWMTAHRFRQLAAFVVTYIAGRRPDKAGHSMFFHVFAHVDADHVLHIVKQHFRQRLGQFGLAHTGGAQEDEGTDRTVGILDAGPGADHRVRHCFHRFILADDMFMQGFFQMDQLFPFAGAQPLYRNTCPGADYPGDIVLVHLFLQQGVVPAGLFLQLLQLLLQFRQAAVFQFRQFIQIVVPFRFFHFLLHGADFFLYFPHLYDAGLFVIPTFDEGSVFRPQFGQLLLEFHQTVRGSRVVFLLQGLFLNFQLQNLTLAFVDLRRRRINLGTKACCRLVYQIDGFVRQEPVVDVSLAHDSRGHQGSILDPHPVMVFIAFLQTAQNGNGILHAGLVDHNRLEPAFQGAVFFNIFMVLVQGGGADTTQLAPGQHRFQNITCIHGTFRCAGTHYGVQLVDKHDDLPGAVRHRLQHFFQTLFKFTPVFGPGYQGSQIQCVQGFVLQTFRYVPGYDTAGQPFYDCRFAYAGLADKHRVVLFPPAQDLNSATDLVVPADYRVQLALTGPGGQILTELFQGLFAFVVGRTVQVMLIQLFNLIAVDSVFFKQPRYVVASVAGQSGYQMADSHVALPRLTEHNAVDPGEIRTHKQLPVLSFHRRNAADQSPGFVGKSIFVYFKCFQQEFDKLIIAGRQQKMGAGHFLIVIHQCLLLGRFNNDLYIIHIVFVHIVSLLLQKLPAQAGKL